MKKLAQQQTEFESKIESTWKDKIIEDATEKVVTNSEILDKVVNNVLCKINPVLTNIQKSFIGEIAWFTTKKNINSGWFAIRNKVYTIILADGNEIKTPVFREGEFIRHNLQSVLKQENSEIKLHSHWINIQENFDSGANASLFISKTTTKKDMFTDRIIYIGKPDSSDYPEGNITERFAFGSALISEDEPNNYGLFMRLKGVTDNFGGTETRPQNISLIAHIYIGLGAKLKLDIVKVKEELKPYIVQRDDENQIKYIYWETNFFNQYIKDMIQNTPEIHVGNDKKMIRVLYSQEDHVYILIYHNWKDL